MMPHIVIVERRSWNRQTQAQQDTSKPFHADHLSPPTGAALTVMKIWVPHHSLPVDREREQDVPRNPAPLPVSRVHVNHAARDRGASAIERTTMRLLPIDCVEIARSIEVPDNISGRARVRAEVTIHRSLKHYIRNRRDRPRLCRSAILLLAATLRHSCPCRPARDQIESRKPSA